MTAPTSKPARQSDSKRNAEMPGLHDRALQDLSFIRRTMEGAASFTDVPGWGLVLLGLLAVAAATLANQQPTAERWLSVWMLTAALGATIGCGAIVLKMRRRVGAGTPLLMTVPARKFLLSYWPAMLSAVVLTLALIDPLTDGIAPRVIERLLPGVWLLLYGVGVTTAGAFSIRAVPLMGLGFMALGTFALFVPAVDGDLMMALGFGVLQTVFGVYIARRHGG